jgi:hypothetical protein
MRLIGFFLLSALLVFSGCCAGIPDEIKTEIDLLDTVVSTAVRETASIEDPTARAEKAVRALKRAAPHTANLRSWIDGKEDTDGD